MLDPRLNCGRMSYLVFGRIGLILVTENMATVSIIITILKYAGWIFNEEVREKHLNLPLPFENFQVTFTIFFKYSFSKIMSLFDKNLFIS